VFNRNTSVDVTEGLYYFPIVSRIILKRGVKGRATLKNVRQRQQDPLVQNGACFIRNYKTCLQICLNYSGSLKALVDATEALFISPKRFVHCRLHFCLLIEVQLAFQREQPYSVAFRHHFNSILAGKNVGARVDKPEDGARPFRENCKCFI